MSGITRSSFMDVGPILGPNVCIVCWVY